ncbi:response regulator, partial [bacterium]|nr:response regulator [bacterium]
VIRNLIIGSLYGIAFAFVFYLSLSRLLKPINRLTEVMGLSTEGNYTKVSEDIQSSLEVSKISTAYNHMISTLADRDRLLRNQRDLLETEVALRTNELVQARDTALQANQHKSEFLANVTHELRTPLQSILGYAEVLQETLEDEGFFDSTDDLKKISNNASHLLQLINGILDIAKIEAGQVSLDSRATNIEKLAVRAFETIEPLAKKNGNHLAIHTQCDADDIMIDGTKLYQIMINLLGNAAKFTRDGNITFEVSCTTKQLSISVKDTGIGISEEQQKLVFEPFRQVDGSESREFVGTGLGLTITLQLTKLLNGEIDLTSQLGEGSHFTVNIPLSSKQHTAQA